MNASELNMCPFICLFSPSHCSLQSICSWCIHDARRCITRIIRYITFVQQYVPDALCYTMVSGRGEFHSNFQQYFFYFFSSSVLNRNLLRWAIRIAQNTNDATDNGCDSDGNSLFHSSSSVVFSLFMVDVHLMLELEISANIIFNCDRAGVLFMKIKRLMLLSRAIVESVPLDSTGCVKSSSVFR